MPQIKKAGIVCCSNGCSSDEKDENHLLSEALKRCGTQAVFGDHIYAKDKLFSGTGAERAGDLMAFYRDPAVDAIFDISGGDIANEVLEYLDYPVIQKSGKMFWGYSDLTTVINAVYSQTGNKGVLYQIKNIVRECSEEQEARYRDYNNGTNSALFDIAYRFVRGSEMSGTVIGGNIRCLLKLAGTPYFPDAEGKILLLEAMGGHAPQMTAYLNQLQQMGLFDRISGILLGTFSAMDKEKESPSMEELVLRFAARSLPIVKTEDIGHSPDAKAIIIGENYYFAKDGALNSR